MKLFIITGTSRGLGKALAEKLQLQKDIDLITIGRHSANHIQADFSRPEDCYNLFEKNCFPFKEYEEVILINNAGTLNPTAPVGAAESSALLSHVTINAAAPLLLINELLKSLCAVTYTGKVEIINISSGAGRGPMYGWAAYCGSKAFMDMMSRVIALEADSIDRPFTVKCWAIAPGVVDTDMQGHIRSLDQENFKDVKDFVAKKEKGKLLQPELVADRIIKNRESCENGGIYHIRDIYPEYDNR